MKENERVNFFFVCKKKENRRYGTHDEPFIIDGLFINDYIVVQRLE